MEYRIETISEKKLVGMKQTMSMAQNNTRELWKRFMQRKSEIKNTIGTELYSMQVYPPSYFNSFNPNTEFVKWAAVEVESFDDIPDDMEMVVLHEGLYAVFLHVGAASAAPQTFQYIFGEWLPNSDYRLDNRLHFEIIGEKYKNDHPDSEEEVWIPIR